MRSLRVAVLGGGTAGLSTALAVARGGHRVTLVERDRLEQTAPDDAFRWSRPGVAHFLLRHAFNPRGRREMRAHLPEIYAAVLDAGAEELDLRPDIFRAHLRRLGFLDRTAVLDDDVALQQRMEIRFAELRASRPAPAGPTRDELLARLPPAA